MARDLKEHLENIRIFTDFKKSEFDTIEDFWDGFDQKGNNHLEFFEYDHAQEISDPTTYSDEEDKFSLDNNVSNNRDLCDEYIIGVENSIEKAIDENRVRLPTNFPIKDIYEEIIMRCGNIEKYLATTKEIVHEYVTLASGMSAKDFFSFLAKRHRGEIKVRFVKKVVEVLNENPHPRIFINLKAYHLFENWVYTKNTDSDLSFIYRTMKNDGLIYNDVGDEEFLRFLYINYYPDRTIGKLKSLTGISATRRKPQYEALKESILNS